MAILGNLQRRWLAGLVYLASVIGCFVLFGSVLFEPVASDPADERIRESAIAMVVWWPISVALLLALRRHPESYSASILRVNYCIACAMGLLHVAVAFHLGHGWSHELAYQQTAQASGFGAGIFVNDFFMLLWVAESVWMWVALHSYLNRPAWLNWLIIGFMGFIFFNGAIVFAHGPMRWLNAVFLIAPFVILRHEIG